MKVSLELDERTGGGLPQAAGEGFPGAVRGDAPWACLLVLCMHGAFDKNTVENLLSCNRCGIMGVTDTGRGASSLEYGFARKNCASVLTVRCAGKSDHRHHSGSALPLSKKLAV